MNILLKLKRTHTAKHTPDASIVRLSDKRIGVLHKAHQRKGYAIVKLDPDLGVEVKLSEPLNVLLYPHELAAAALEEIVKHPATLLIAQPPPSQTKLWAGGLQ